MNGASVAIPPSFRYEAVSKNGAGMEQLGWLRGNAGVDVLVAISKLPPLDLASAVESQLAAQGKVTASPPSYMGSSGRRTPLFCAYKISQPDSSQGWHAAYLFVPCEAGTVMFASTSAEPPETWQLPLYTELAKSIKTTQPAKSK